MNATTVTQPTTVTTSQHIKPQQPAAIVELDQQTMQLIGGGLGTMILG